jgi:hypothetical protein
MTLDEQIRTNLRSAAQTVPWSEPAPVYQIQRKGRVRRRNRHVGLGAVIVVLVLGTLYMANARNELYVADGERLISAEPLVVLGAEAPEPEFNTSDLGDDVTLTPITDIATILGLAEQAADGEITRVTVVGETPEGIDALVVHSEQDDPDFGRIQTRCVITEVGASCDGTQIENVVDQPGGLLPPEPGRTHGYSVDSIGGRGDLAWEVPGETSVVMLSINGETRWQRPIANVAIFITNFRDGDRFELTAFDVQGNVLDRVSQVVRLKPAG